MKAYKVFNSDWTCRGFQYEVGKTYTENGEIELCSKGFHACKKVSDCFSYYSFNPANKVAEVELSGEILGEDEDKQCSSIITIVKEVSWTDMLTLANSGIGNSGNGNSGNGNSGNGNSGSRNSGSRNSGSRNSGSRNSGSRNSGDWNSGDWNSGNGNSGSRNSGDWNSGSRNSGMFNVDEPFIRMFGKETNLKRCDISIPSFLYFDLTQWVSHDTATEEEKTAHKQDIEICGGFLKTIDYKEAFQRAWVNASEGAHNQVKALPNFDADIFFKISGVRV
jgi:hypothetical protein